MSELTLYTYFRSSAAYRVRIALHLKGLAYKSEFIHLINDGGEQTKLSYTGINPQGLVPSLLTDGVGEGTVLTQSLAIIEYLDERYPTPNLLPFNLEERAYVRSLALMVACDIHPLNNLRVTSYLNEQLNVGEADQKQWYSHWIEQGLGSLEQRIGRHNANSRFCLGKQPGLADLCLVPQVYNAKRFECDIRGFPIIRRIFNNCMELDPFQKAAPEQQDDYV